MAIYARFWAYVDSVSTGSTIRTRTANSGDANWGTSLDGNDTEWDSTKANLEGDLAISGTGWKSWDIDSANLALGTGTTWMRLTDIYENDGNTRSVTFRTENRSGTTFDPYLEIWEVADAVGAPPTLATLGVGS